MGPKLGVIGLDISKFIEVLTNRLELNIIITLMGLTITTQATEQSGNLFEMTRSNALTKCPINEIESREFARLLGTNLAAGAATFNFNFDESNVAGESDKLDEQVKRSLIISRSVFMSLDNLFKIQVESTERDTLIASLTKIAQNIILDALIAAGEMQNDISNKCLNYLTDFIDFYGGDHFGKIRKLVLPSTNQSWETTTSPFFPGVNLIGIEEFSKVPELL